MPKLGLGASTRYFVPLFTGSAINYGASVLATNPIAYYPTVNDTTTTIDDVSTNDNDGTYTGATLQSEAFPTGGAAPLFDGVNDYGDLPTAPLGSLVDFDECTISIWYKVDAGALTDATLRNMFQIRRDASNNLQIRKLTTDNTLNALISVGGNTDSISFTNTDTGWNNIAFRISVSNDRFRVYLNGVQQGATQTGLSAQTGTGLALTVLGAGNTSPLNPFDGNLAHFAIWDRELNDSELASVAVITGVND